MKCWSSIARRARRKPILKRRRGLSCAALSRQSRLLRQVVDSFTLGKTTRLDGPLNPGARLECDLAVKVTQIVSEQKRARLSVGTVWV